MRPARFLGFGGPVVVTALILNMVVAHASGPYKMGQAGYDVSFPQGTAYSVPAGSSFGIIGVNNGRPFTSNPYFSSQYSGVANSVYINTGYAKTYASNVTSGCSARAPSMAWAIGCSEAETSLNSIGTTAPSMWWIDVETANSWSSGRLTPNRDTIQGAINRLRATSRPVGVYSTPSAWSRITGKGFVPSGVSGVWIPAAQCQGTPSFITGVSVWLTQQPASTPGTIDGDSAC